MQTRRALELREAQPDDGIGRGPEQLVGVGHRDPAHDAVRVRLVVAHTPESGRVAVDRHGRLAVGVAHTVDVRRVEVERPSRLVPVRALADPPVLVAVEVILEDRALANDDRSLRTVVVVVAGVLLCRPADQPDVDVRVAIQLHVVTLVGGEAHVVAPEALLAPHLGREREQRGTVEVGVCHETTGEPGGDVDVGHGSSRAGVSCLTSVSTDSPKPLIARAVGSGSTTGRSLP